MNKKLEGEGFTSKWGLLFSLIALSVGSGNIWRFPRMVAMNGGGSFVIAWTIFLFVFSIPLIMAETIIGRSTRHGCPGAFRDFLGKKFTWMGTFMIYCGLGIAAYYSVVVGWTFKYFTLQAAGKLNLGSLTASNGLWNAFINSPLQVLLFHFIAVAIGGFVIYRGVSGGIEKVCKILVPAVFGILIITAIRSLTLPGAVDGLNFFFTPSWESFKNPQTWLHALTQSAWSVGPGWGLVITYAAHTRSKEDVTVLEVGQGVGNNVVALLAGLTIIPAIFALAPSQEYITQAMSSGNTGLVFEYLPLVFSQMFGGWVLGTLFFLALAFAAYSTLISCMETGVLPLIDAGMSRKKATLIICSIILVGGIPSALSITFLNNQDMVLAVALLVASLFTGYAVIKFGLSQAREKFLNNEHAAVRTGKWWDICIKYIVPISVVLVTGWWLKQSIEWYPETWWNPFEEYSFGTIAFQVIIALILVKVFNNKVANSVKRKYFNGESYPPIPNRENELEQEAK